MNLQRSNSFALPLFIIFSLLFIITIQWWGYGNNLIGFDDANIYFVYMKNLAQGQGFVWNYGGEHVEGFTSLLWTVIGALLYKLSPTHYQFLLLLLSFVLTFFTLYKTLLFARKLNQEVNATLTYTDVLITAFLVLPLGFVEWTVLSLMETGLWTFLITSISLQLANFYYRGNIINRWQMGLLLALLVLTRPESMLLGFLFVSLFYLLHKPTLGSKKALLYTTPLLLVCTFVLLGVIAWRISYFGYPFPNTYYAKVSSNKLQNFTGGFIYLIRFLQDYPHIIFIIMLAAYYLYHLCKQEIASKKNHRSILPSEKAALLILIIAVTCFLLPLLTGGDHFKYGRFFQPCLPILYAILLGPSFFKTQLRFSNPPPTTLKNTLLISACFLLGAIGKYNFSEFVYARRSPMFGYVIIDFEVAKNGRTIAAKANETFDKNQYYPSIGCVSTGSIGYYYKGQTIDLMGLNNIAMAHANPEKKGFRNHASFSKKVFWQLLPNMMGSSFGAEIVTDSSNFQLAENDPMFDSDFNNKALGKIFFDADFQQQYQPALVKKRTNSYFIFSYYNKKFLTSLDTSSFAIIPLQRQLDKVKLSLK